MTFRRGMDHLFDHFGGFFGRAGDATGRIASAMDLQKTEKEMVVMAELPGVRIRSEATLVGDVLTIKGEKKAETVEKKGRSYYTELRSGPLRVHGTCDSR